MGRLKLVALEKMHPATAWFVAAGVNAGTHSLERGDVILSINGEKVDSVDASWPRYWLSLVALMAG